MKILIAIPVMGQYEIGRISLYQFDQISSPECRFLLIDNGGNNSSYFDLFKRGFLSAGRWTHLVNSENIGLIRSNQQAYEYAKSAGFDVLVMTHNDVWLYPPIGLSEDYGCATWDEVLLSEFQSSRFSPGEFGVVGLFGSKGCGKEGHRINTFGANIEMAGHGRKMTSWIEPTVCLDGFFMACSMKMLDAVGGFDQRYQWHHVYDMDVPLASIEAGFKNAIINIPCHHLSGMTANNDAKATSGQDIHQANADLWRAKWQSKLGLAVDDNWNYTWRLGQ